MLKDEYKERFMTDVEFSRWLKKKGWLGHYHHVNEYCYFTLGAIVLAVVKYKNDCPVNRWIYIKE